MMRRNLPIILLVLVALAAILGLSSLYVVDVRQKALVMRFGRVVDVRETPGLWVKVPFIDQVLKYDARILGRPTEPMEVTPLDDRRLIVDAFARWQITDAQRFRRAVGRSGVDGAYDLLGPILTNAIRGTLGSVPSTTVLSDDRTSLMNQIRDAARDEADAIGVQIVDVRLTRTDFPEQNLTATYGRMRAEREREAADEIGRGNEAARRVRAAADRTVVELTSEARRRSEMIKGEAEARRNAIFAEAYNRDQEFFAFTRSLEAYEKSFDDGNTAMVLKPEGQFFDYLRSPGDPADGVSEAARVQYELEAQMEAAGLDPLRGTAEDPADMPELNDPELRAPSVEDLSDEIPGIEPKTVPSVEDLDDVIPGLDDVDPASEPDTGDEAGDGAEGDDAPANPVE